MKLVVVGGSDAGISAALRARELDRTTDVTLLVADAYPNFSICGLPYYLSGEVANWKDLAHRTIEAELLRHNVELHTNTIVSEIYHEDAEPCTLQRLRNLSVIISLIGVRILKAADTAAKCSVELTQLFCGFGAYFARYELGHCLKFWIIDLLPVLNRA